MKEEGEKEEEVEMSQRVKRKGICNSILLVAENVLNCDCV